MADLVDRVDNALNEARTMVLVAQVLFAYFFESTFERKFGELPQLARLMTLTGITLLLVSLAFLLAPAPFHYIVEDTDDSEGFHKTASAFVMVVLPIYAAALALQFAVFLWSAVGSLAAGLISGALFALALWYWVGMELLARRHRGRA